MVLANGQLSQGPDLDQSDRLVFAAEALELLVTNKLMKNFDWQTEGEDYIRAVTRAAMRPSASLKISTKLSVSGTPEAGTENSNDHTRRSGMLALPTAWTLMGSTEKYFGSACITGRISTPCFQYKLSFSELICDRV